MQYHQYYMCSLKRLGLSLFCVWVKLDMVILSFHTSWVEVNHQIYDVAIYKSVDNIGLHPPVFNGRVLLTWSRYKVNAHIFVLGLFFILVSEIEEEVSVFTDPLLLFI